MSPKISAGFLVYRKAGDFLEVLLAHYGGPLWARKDLGSWTVVKGEISEEENQKMSLRGITVPQDSYRATKQSSDFLLGTAKREFTEETGIDISRVADFISLGEIKQRGGKIVHAWAFQFCHPELVEGQPKRDIQVHSNTFEMEWPPHSGQIQKFPEIDRAEFFSLDLARQKINQAQVPFLDRLSQSLSS